MKKITFLNTGSGFLRCRGEICEVMLVWVPLSTVPTMMSGWYTFIARSRYLGWFKCGPVFSAILGVQTRWMFLGVLQCATTVVGHVMRRSIWHAGAYSQVLHQIVMGCHARQLLGHVLKCRRPSAFSPVQPSIAGYSSLENQRTWRVLEWGEKPQYCLVNH